MDLQNRISSASFLTAAVTTGGILAASMVGYLSWDWLQLVRRTLGRDISVGMKLKSIQKIVQQMNKDNELVITLFEKTAKIHEDKLMFKFEGKTWTFGEVDRMANQIAACFYKKGYKKGDCVALLMDNRPDLVIYWLGLAKIGVISALINFNLRQSPLVHCINICNAKAVICTDTLYEDAFRPIMGDLSHLDDSTIFVLHVDPKLNIEHGYSKVNELVAEEKDTSSGYERPSDMKITDTVIYIFTSGTTGLPKAAKMTNSRALVVFVSFDVIAHPTSDDVIWSPLPFYHTNAGILALGMSLRGGACLAFRQKFSASNFWKDIKESQSTIFIYLGEICRYIYAQPEKPEETDHKLRLIVGAGLKKEIWGPFVKRFKIPNVLEMYGSTEGNCSIANLTGKEGACGFVSRLFPFLVPIRLIRVDEEGNLIRDPKTGVCITCKPNEPGHIVGKILKSDPMRQFDGYLGEKETNKKIIHDVFNKGDCAFIAGDIMLMDEDGYLFFKDRTGDTFRWKGENVSTTEVEAVIFPAVDQKDTIVFGVEIPNCDGKAGMAAILNEHNSVDMNKVTEAVNKHLPSYAKPMFVRLLSSTAEHLTGTYKLKKTELVKDGYKIACNSKDDVFFYDLKSKSYTKLGPEQLELIEAGQIRF